MGAVGDLVVNLGIDTNPFVRGLATAVRTSKSFASDVVSGLGSIGLAAQGLGAIGSWIKTIANPFASMVGMAAEAEQIGISFEVMLGSGEAAQAMLADFRNLAASSPLETKDINDAGKTLLQFGVQAGQVLPVVKMLGDVAGGDGEKLKSFALVFGQISAAGKLTGGDLLQLINNGFNPLMEISRRTGRSMGDLRSDMEAGKISAAMVAESFQAATSQGGQFFGMLDRQGKSTSGLFGQMKDGVSLSMVDIGTAIIEGFNLNGLLVEANSFLDSFRSEWLPGITGGVATIGGHFQVMLADVRGWWAESGQSVMDFASNAVSGIADFVANLGLYSLVAVEYWQLFATNSLERVRTFFINAVELLPWLGENWQNTLFTMGDYASTIFINLGKNIRDLWTGVLSFIAGNGFTFNPTPLLEGAKSAMSELPELTKAAIRETTPEMDALFGQLADRQAAAAKAAAAAAKSALEGGQAATTAQVGLDPSKFGTGGGTGDKPGKKAGESKTLAGAAQIGSSDAYSTIARSISMAMGVSDPATAELKKQTGSLDKIESHLAKMSKDNLPPVSQSLVAVELKG